MTMHLLCHMNALCTSTDCNKDCGPWGILVNCTVCQCIDDDYDDDDADFGGLVYYVYDGPRQPIANVKVYVVGREWKEWTSTNSEGRYRFV